MNYDDKKLALKKTLEMFELANIVVSDDEKNNIEITDFQLGNLDVMGLQLLTLVNNERYCAKQLVLFPHQNCPEHRHPPFEDNIGKQETFRCLYGECFLYVEGDETVNPKVNPPKGKEQWYSAKHEICLYPGDQFTIKPNTKHWFQAGDKGAVIAEFSSQSRDEFDIFSDPEVVRIDDASKC